MCGAEKAPALRAADGRGRAFAAPAQLIAVASEFDRWDGPATVEASLFFDTLHICPGAASGEDRRARQLAAAAMWSSFRLLARETIEAAPVFVVRDARLGQALASEAALALATSGAVGFGEVAPSARGWATASLDEREPLRALYRAYASELALLAARARANETTPDWGTKPAGGAAERAARLREICIGRFGRPVVGLRVEVVDEHKFGGGTHAKLPVAIYQVSCRLLPAG